MIEDVVSEYWEGMVDYCCQLIDAEPLNMLQTDKALTILLNIGDRISTNKDNKAIFNRNLLTLGGESLFESTC